jgi:lipid-A-disaccharide synthase
MLTGMLSIGGFSRLSVCNCRCSSQILFYENFITKRIKFISNKTYDLLKIATAALVTGTATLETAFKVPEVVL